MPRHLSSVFDLDKKYLAISWETLKPVIYAQLRIFLLPQKSLLSLRVVHSLVLL